MSSLFDGYASVASQHMFRVFGDTIEIDGVPGVGVVLPETNLMTDAGISLINGAHLTVMAEDFPNLAYHSVVTYNGTEYMVLELDDVDFAGMRKMRMAIN